MCSAQAPSRSEEESFHPCQTNITTHIKDLPVAVHVFLEMDGKVLLFKRQNTDFRDGEWSVPDGRVEPGELVLAAAVREAREEAAVEIDPAGLSQSKTIFHEDESGQKMYIFSGAPNGRASRRTGSRTSVRNWPGMI